MRRRDTVLTTLSPQRPSRANPAAVDPHEPDAGGLAPRLVCFPRDDPRFAERVQTLLEIAGPGGPFTAAVQALLREEYPLAVISPRHQLAAIDGTRVWYVFREGALIPVADGPTR